MRLTLTRARCSRLNAKLIPHGQRLDLWAVDVMRKVTTFSTSSAVPYHPDLAFLRVAPGEG
jgi:hypothetical protein